MKPMRMLVLLAVFWAAGSFLLAAETPPARPAPAAQSDVKSSGANTGAQEESKKEESKNDESTDASRPSVAEQAEAALKAAAEADGGAAKESPGGEDQDDTQAPPAGSAGKGSSPQRFVPSEQVRADFDVSFPIDI